MGKKGGSKVLLALGGALAFIAGVIVFVLANSATQSATTEEMKEQVVVARTEIPERAKLTRDLIDVVAMPVSLIPPNSIRKLEDVADKLYSKVRLYPRMPISLSQTAATKPEDVPTDVQPLTGPAPKPAVAKLIEASFALEPGQTMVSVDYPEAAKLIAAGILKTGDRVNVFIKVPGAGGDQVAQVFPSNNRAIQPNGPKPLEIKAIGTLAPLLADAPAVPSATMIFAVTPQEAIILKLLETLNPFFLIQGAADKDNVLQTNVVTLDGIQRAVGLSPTAR